MHKIQMLNIMINKREDKAFLIVLMMFHKSVGSLQEQKPTQRDAFRHHQPVHVSSVCVDLESLVQEEMSQRKLSETVCTDDQKPKGVQHRSRTTFTQEQSKALEQGRNPPSMTKKSVCACLTSTKHHINTQMRASVS